jgi:hypothetical protein
MPDYTKTSRSALERMLGEKDAEIADLTADRKMLLERLREQIRTQLNASDEPLGGLLDTKAKPR